MAFVWLVHAMYRKRSDGLRLRMERSLAATKGRESEEQCRRKRHASPTYYPFELGPGVGMKAFISSREVFAIGVCECERNGFNLLACSHYRSRILLLWRHTETALVQVSVLSKSGRISLVLELKGRGDRRRIFESRQDKSQPYQ